MNKETLKTLMELAKMLEGDDAPAALCSHPMLGKRCLVRTYSAGVHIGDVVWINPENSMECKLDNALRLWKWEGGGLSLPPPCFSLVARRGYY